MYSHYLFPVSVGVKQHLVHFPTDHAVSSFFFFFLMTRPPPRSTLFPYPPLFRSRATTTGVPSPSRKSRSTPPPPPPDSTLGWSSGSWPGLLSCDNAVRLHREVLRQAQPVGARRGFHVARFDPLPELAVVVPARERRGILLRLMLEDREHLRPQLVLGQRHQDVRPGERPLLPRAAVQPHLRAGPVAARERLRDRRLAHAVGPVRIGQVARAEHEVRVDFLGQAAHDRDIF